MNRILIRVLPTLIAALPILLFAAEAAARAGGGRNKGGGILGLILFPFIVAYGWYVNSRLKKRQQEVESALSAMAHREPQWAKENLLRTAREKFILLQAAWGNQDLATIRTHLHPTLYPSWEMQITAQKLAGTQNVMAGLSVNQMRIVDAKNFTDDEHDEFTVCFDAKANDQTIRNGTVIASENSGFREFWTFEWEKGYWVLREVTESGGWKRFINSQIVYEPAKRKAG